MNNGFEQSTNKKTKSNLGFIIALITIAIIICGTVSVIILKNLLSSPMNEVGKAFLKSAEKLSKSSEFRYVSELTEEGSVDINCDLGKVLSSFLFGYELDADADLTFYFDKKDKKNAVSADVFYNGTSIADALICINDESVALSSAVLLGDEAYGFGFDDFAERFNGSIFGENGEYSLDIDGKQIEDLISNGKTLGEKEEEGIKILTGIFAEFAKTVDKNAEYEKSNDSLRIGDKTVKTKEIEVSFNDKALAEILWDLITYVKNNDELRDYLYDNSDFISSLPVMIREIDADKIIDEFYEMLEDVDRGDIRDELDGIKVKANFIISRSTKELIGLEIHLSGRNDEDIKINFIAGPTFSDLKEVTAEVELDGSVYELSYIIEADSKEEFVSEFRLTNNSEYIAKADIDWDKTDGDFRLKVSVDGDDIIFRAGILSKNGVTAVEPRDIQVNGNSAALDFITVTVSCGAKIPEIKNYKDVLSMSTDDFDDIADRIKTELRDLISLIE